MTFVLSLESSQFIYKSKVYRWMHQWKERKKRKEEGRKKGANWIFSGTNLNQQVLKSKIKCPRLLSLCRAVLRCAIPGSLKGPHQGWDLDAHTSLTHFLLMFPDFLTCACCLSNKLLTPKSLSQCCFWVNSSQDTDLVKVVHINFPLGVE